VSLVNTGDKLVKKNWTKAEAGLTKVLFKADISMSRQLKTNWWCPKNKF